MVTCPHCNGKGETFAFVNARPRHYARNIQCRECGGTGQITEAHAERKEIANRMWRERIESRRVTLRDEAKRLSCDFGEWSRIENGREPETDAGRAAWAKRLEEIGVNL